MEDQTAPQKKLKQICRTLNVGVGSLLPTDGIPLIPVTDTAIPVFSNSSTSEVTQPFVVLPGRAVLLSAFDIPCSNTIEYPKNFCLSIEKVQMDYGTLPSSKQCNHMDASFKPELIIACEPMMQCGEWSLDDTQTAGIISLPGTYQIRMSDPDLIGIVTVFLTGLRGDSMEYIPDDLFFGKMSTTC